MKPLSFEEWYSFEYGASPSLDCDLNDYLDDIRRYADYRDKLAWNEAAKAQIKICLRCITTIDRDLRDVFEAVKNAPLVEYKETL